MLICTVCQDELVNRRPFMQMRGVAAPDAENRGHPIRIGTGKSAAYADQPNCCWAGVLLEQGCSAERR